jgi:hypothetical protein
MKPFPALTRPDFVTFILSPNAALDYQTYIPILLQGAALVAVRHCRVTNFPSWVRTATRAAPRKWQRAIALGADAKGFIGFC